jgi:hypothetical protein
MGPICFWPVVNPTYHGRDLGAWAEALSKNPVDPEAKAAIQYLVRRHLPVLVDRVAYDPMPRRLRLARFYQSPPSLFLTFPRVTSWLLSDRRDEQAGLASTVLALGGSAAKPAVPRLRQMVVSAESMVVLYRSLEDLLALDDQPAETLMRLLLVTTEPRANYIAHRLSKYPEKVCAVVDLLLAAANSPDEAAASAALNRLSVFSSQEEWIPMVKPALECATHDPRRAVRRVARNLYRISYPESLDVPLPVLDETLAEEEKD